MIHQALSILAEELNLYLTRSMGGGTSQNLVSLAGLTSNTKEEAKNALIITLINVQEEKAKPNLRPSIELSKQLPPLQLNLHMLLTASFQNYPSSLKMLSATLFFFQSKPLFTIENTPSLAGSVTRISAEIVNHNSQELSSIYSMLGTNYQPSLVYKFSVLGINESELIPEITPIIDISRDVNS